MRPLLVHSRFEQALVQVELSPELRDRLLQLATVLDTLLDLQDERSRLAPILRADQAQLGIPLQFEARFDRALRAQALEEEVHQYGAELRALVVDVIQRLMSHDGNDREACLTLLALVTSEAAFATSIVEKLRDAE